MGVSDFVPAIAVAIVAILHAAYGKKLFLESRIPLWFLGILGAASIFWNVWVGISNALSDRLEILLSGGISGFFFVLISRSIGLAYAKYLLVLSSFFLLQGKVAVFFLFCIGAVFSFVTIDILRFNLRILFSKGPFFSYVPGHVTKECAKMVASFEFKKTLSYVAVFVLLLFFVRAAQSFFSENVFSLLGPSFGNVSFAMFAMACAFAVSWLAFRFVRPVFSNVRASVVFIVASLGGIVFWHFLAPVPLVSTIHLFVSSLLPLAIVAVVTRLFRFYSDVMGTDLVDYRELNVGDLLDTKYLFSVWYDYQPGNERILRVLKTLKNPIDVKSKERIARFFETCLLSAQKKNLNGFHPRFQVRILRPVSVVPIIVPVFLACFWYFGRLVSERL